MPITNGKGVSLTEEEILHEVGNYISDACCLAFELETDLGKGIAFMLDSMLKLVYVAKTGGNPLDATDDFEKYEMQHPLIRTDNSVGRVSD